MKIYPATESNIKKAAALIKSGGVVSFPTETVYGLGADAFNPAAVARIFEIKKRPYFDPLIVHLSDISQLHLIAWDINKTAMDLAEKFWPGPLTLILRKKDSVPDIVTSGLNTVACRVPGHAAALKLIGESGTPIAAPSANPFGFLSPTRAEHVYDQLGESVDMILDGGASAVGVESTIIAAGVETVLLRPGGVSLEDIEKVTGKILIQEKGFSGIEAPGQYSYHYSPATPVRLEKKIDFFIKGAGYILLKRPANSYPEERTEILSEKGDLKEAAANLFTALHRLDKLNLSVIIAEYFEEIGLGLAIMDRLKKASQKNIKG